MIMTIGHSNMELDHFIRTLTEFHEVNHVVDVRSYPGSRYVPQFNKESLSVTLPKANIKYSHLPALGGRRKASGYESVNTAWRNKSFRNYADYMQTSDFSYALDDLIDLAKNDQVAIMCAEYKHWKCHRSMIADALVALCNIRVDHIVHYYKRYVHSLTAFAKVVNGRVTYPGSPDQEIFNLDIV